MMQDITDLNHWTNIVPSVFTYSYNPYLSFVMITLDMQIGETLSDLNLEESHPFGLADLYVCSFGKSENAEFNFSSDLVSENRTITFCMEVANAIQKGWDEKGIGSIH